MTEVEETGTTAAIPNCLDAVRTELDDIHQKLHRASNDAGQRNPNLREAVSAASAALAAVQRAHGHAVQAYAQEGRR